MTHLVYLDIDGVLADERHRQHFATATPPRWDDYFADAAVRLDNLWPEGWALYKELLTRPDTEVRYLTGRRIDLAPVTQTWLADQGFDPTLVLEMKSMTTLLRLAAFKATVITQRLAEFETVTIYDDDPRVIAAVIAMGDDRAVGVFCGWHVKPQRMVSKAVA